MNEISKLVTELPIAAMITVMVVFVAYIAGAIFAATLTKSEYEFREDRLSISMIILSILLSWFWVAIMIEVIKDRDSREEKEKEILSRKTNRNKVY